MISDTVFRNRLLSSLEPRIQNGLRPFVTLRDLHRGDVMAEAGAAISSLYFPDSGLGSVVAMSATKRLEVGVFGREGMCGISLLAGVERSPHNVFMQIPGKAWELTLEGYTSIIAPHAPSMALLRLYAHAFGVQVAETAFSNGLFSLDARLARWLLMCHDRIDGDAIAITHEFLSIMLGVHRPAVTIALQTTRARASSAPAGP
jgi:CRP-like cAMP-binding protein